MNHDCLTKFCCIAIQPLDFLTFPTFPLPQIFCLLLYVELNVGDISLHQCKTCYLMQLGHFLNARCIPVVDTSWVADAAK